MASGVNVKMGVSGVQQFKQGMQQARQSVKTLDAELQLNEKQFKASGDAEEYMQKKADLLQKKIQEQQKAVDNATKALEEMEKNGVDKASTAYQKMAQQLIQAKGDLLDTETALGNIGTAAEEAESGVTGLQSELQGINKKLSYDQVIDGISTITSGLETAFQAAWRLGRALVNNTLGAGAWADELATTAAQFEISPERLQRMRYTADIIDTNAETILQAQNKMKSMVGGGTKSVITALSEVFEGEKLSNIVSTDPEELFWNIGEAIMGMGEAYKRENAAQKLFGRSWRDLLPVFTAGREEYEKWNASWNVVSKENIDNLTKMDDQYQVLKNNFETTQMELLSSLAGPLTEAMQTLNGVLDKFNEYLKTPEGKEMLKQIGDTISGLLTDLTKVDPDKVVEGVKDAIENVKSGLEWVSTHSQDVIDGLKAIFAGWGVLKLTGGALKMLNLINGLRGLGVSNYAASGAAAGASWAGAFAKAAMKAAPFLAFLYTLLNPASTSDALGANKIDDENGTVSEEAARLGFEKNEKGEVVQNLDKVDTRYVDPDFLAWQKRMQAEKEKAQQTAEEMADMTPQQKLAIQRFWDAYRANPEDYDSAEWDRFESAFKGQEDLFALVNDIIDQFGNDNGVGQDETWRTIEDIPEYLFTSAKERDESTKESVLELKKIPDRLAQTVSKEMAGIRIYLDGEQITAVVSRNQGADVYGTVGVP